MDDKARLVTADEMQRRSFFFWARHRSLNWWPIEPKDYTFLGNAVHRVGASLFADWSYDDPIISRYPALDGQRKYVANGFDGVIASWLLAQFDGKVDDGFAQNVERRWTSGQNPLSEPEWSRAIEIFNEHFSGIHQAAGYRTASVIRTITEAAAQERLKMFTRSDAGEFTVSPASHWSAEGAFWRFGECQMNPLVPYILTVPHIVDIVMPAELPAKLLPGNEWIFVETASLNVFLTSLSDTELPSADRAALQLTPNDVASNKNGAKSAHRDAISLAVQALWNGSVPTGITVGQRDDAIISFLKKEGKVIPSGRTIARFFKENGDVKQ